MGHCDRLTDRKFGLRDPLIQRTPLTFDMRRTDSLRALCHIHRNWYSPEIPPLMANPGTNHTIMTVQQATTLSTSLTKHQNLLASMSELCSRPVQTSITSDLSAFIQCPQTETSGSRAMRMH